MSKCPIGTISSLSSTSLPEDTDSQMSKDGRKNLSESLTSVPSPSVRVSSRRTTKQSTTSILTPSDAEADETVNITSEQVEVFELPSRFIPFTLSAPSHGKVYIDPDNITCFYPRLSKNKVSSSSFLVVSSIESPFIVEESTVMIEEMIKQHEMCWANV